MRKPPLIVFYNQPWTVMGGPMSRWDYVMRILPCAMRHPAAVAPILGLPARRLQYALHAISHLDYTFHTLRAGIWRHVPARFARGPEHVDKADIVMFHAPQVDIRGVLTLPKRTDQVWVSFSHESAVRFPEMDHPAYRACMDLTMDYRFSSDVPVPYFGERLVPALREPVAPKTAEAPLAAFVSSGIDGSDRLDYLKRLLAAMPVHSFGRRLNNRRIENDRGATTKMALIKTYKFSFAFENMVETDYVTEKFFQPLAMGSVPVYYGAPNIDDFAPGEKCFIDTRAFDGPEALADHLMRLDRDDAAYDEYHAWRRRPFRAEFEAKLEAVREFPYARLMRAIAAKTGRVLAEPYR